MFPPCVHVLQLSFPVVQEYSLVDRQIHVQTYHLLLLPACASHYKYLHIIMYAHANSWVGPCNMVHDRANFLSWTAVILEFQFLSINITHKLPHSIDRHKSTVAP